MSLLSLSRIKMLRESLEAECIDLEELSEIHEAFLQIPESELPEPRENAMAEDELNELEARVTPLEYMLYDWVDENFGDADDPCYDLGAMANAIEAKFNVKEK